MASYTPNLNLYKKDPILDGNDFFNIKTMMNDNWDKIDESVKAALDDIGDLQSEQVRIATGSYVGTGTYGASNPCSLTFPFVPKVVVVVSNDASTVPVYRGYILIWNRQQGNTGVADSGNGGGNVFTLNGKNLSWYSEYLKYDQLNDNYAEYFWTAIG